MQSRHYGGHGITFWYLFDFFIKEIGSTNIALGHLLLERTGKRLKKEEALFNFSDKS